MWAGSGLWSGVRAPSVMHSGVPSCMALVVFFAVGR